MYDETGVTWGFMQWTFKSGRLQRLLESFKSIEHINFEEDTRFNLFDSVCCGANGVQRFERFGFRITGGKFVDLSTGKALNMNKRADQKRCANICMGRVRYPKNVKQQRLHALGLANLFAGLGSSVDVAEAQTHFAKQEFRRQLRYNRKPLKGNSIEWLLGGDRDNPMDFLWGTPLPALFFTNWQNHPAAAYRLFMKVRKAVDPSDSHAYFQHAWKAVNRSKFGNWGWGKPSNKSPRVLRIRRAIVEFYGLSNSQLPLYK